MDEQKEESAKTNWFAWASVALGLVAILGVFGQLSWSNSEFIVLMILGFAGIVLGFLGRSHKQKEGRIDPIAMLGIFLCIIPSLFLCFILFSMS